MCRSKFVSAVFAALLIVTLVISSVTAQPNVIAGKPEIRKILLGAKGLLINTSDAMDIHTSRIIVARFKLVLEGVEEELTYGLLWFDDTRYRLRDINYSSESFSAKIYDVTGNNVGSVTLAPVELPEATVWAGSADLNNTVYNAYYIQYRVKVKPVEVIAGYCRRNPNDPRCRKLKQAKTEESKEEVIEEYCKKNFDDMRCREFLKRKCKEDPSKEYCSVEEREIGKARRTYVIPKPVTEVALRRRCTECKKRCVNKCLEELGIEEPEKVTPEQKSLAIRCFEKCAREECPKCIEKPKPKPVPMPTIAPGFCKRCCEICGDCGEHEDEERCPPGYECLTRERAKKLGCRLTDRVCGVAVSQACDENGVCEETKERLFCAKCPSEEEEECPEGYKCIRRSSAVEKNCDIIPGTMHICGRGRVCARCPEGYEECPGASECMPKEEALAKGCRILGVTPSECEEGKVCAVCPECAWPYRCIPREEAAKMDCEVNENIVCPREGYVCAKCIETLECPENAECMYPEEGKRKQCRRLSETACEVTSAGRKFCYVCPEEEVETKLCPENYMCVPREEVSEQCEVLTEYSCADETEVCVKCETETGATYIPCPEPYKCLTTSEAKGNNCFRISETPCGFTENNEPQYCYRCELMNIGIGVGG